MCGHPAVFLSAGGISRALRPVAYARASSAALRISAASTPAERNGSNFRLPSVETLGFLMTSRERDTQVSPKEGRTWGTAQDLMPGPPARENQKTHSSNRSVQS
jgi:hypothetical protein